MKGGDVFEGERAESVRGANREMPALMIVYSSRRNARLATADGESFNCRRRSRRS
jgi:hypothetical protein